MKTPDSSQLDTPSTIWDSLETEVTAIPSLARIILFMAGIAVLLAVTGVYAVLNFAINRRTREFGIQIMLGATRESIFRSVMTKGLQQIALGLLCGMLQAVPAAWTFASLTKRSNLPVHSFDISVYGISALVLVAVLFVPWVHGFPSVPGNRGRSDRSAAQRITCLIVLKELESMEWPISLWSSIDNASLQGAGYKRCFHESPSCWSTWTSGSALADALKTESKLVTGAHLMGSGAANLSGIKVTPQECGVHLQ